MPINSVEWTEGHNEGRVITDVVDPVVASWDLQALAPEPVLLFSAKGLVNCGLVSPALVQKVFVGRSHGVYTHLILGRHYRRNVKRLVKSLLQRLVYSCSSQWK